MTRAEEHAAKAARLRGLRTSVPTDLSTSVGTEISTSVPTEVSGSVPTAARAQPPRTTPVRLTLDVSPAMHAALRRLCGELAVELGVAQVSGQAVLRSLIRRLLVDEEARAQLERD